MKLQLDTIAKTIKIEEKVNLGELFNKLEELLPDLKWREFELEMGSITNWVNPWVIPVYPDRYYPSYPLPWITYVGDVGGDTAIEAFTITTVGGVYNIDVT